MAVALGVIQPKWSRVRIALLAGVWVWMALSTAMDAFMPFADGCGGWMMIATWMVLVPLTLVARLVIAILVTISCNTARWLRLPWFVPAAALVFEVPLKVLLAVAPDAGDTGDSCSVMRAHGWTPQAEATVLQALVIAVIIGAMLLLAAAIVDLLQSLGAKRGRRSLLSLI